MRLESLFDSYNRGPGNRGLIVGHDTDMDLTPVWGQPTVRKPDAYIRPRNLPQPPPGAGADPDDTPYPTVVVEIGLSESTGSLHKLATEYFDSRTTVRVYIAIKIWPRRADGTFAALVLRYLRGNDPNTTPDQVISFGPGQIHQVALNTMPAVIPPLITGNHRPGAPLCNAFNLPGFRITVPLIELYHGVPGGVPAGPAGVAPPNLVVDLFELLEMIYV
eukprot:TRINITY_DN5103_c0_g1_i2.p1 TRINITY_DN5103_c0_g1~~TRINITY_DN5103_c0_g1_i2.p1  ORF type:complete len:219 (+),score=29.89 TRINITY_DN5103_c0_g1_i2:615-1271(+)